MKKLLKKVWKWIKTPLDKLGTYYATEGLYQKGLQSCNPDASIDEVIRLVTDLDKQVPCWQNMKCLKELNKSKEYLRLRNEDRTRRKIKGTMLP